MINVYSKSESELGRLLSNFAHTPFIIGGKRFESVEAFWYWYMTDADAMRFLYGSNAKRVGKMLTKVRDHPDRTLLKLVYYAKLRYNPEIQKLLLASGDEEFEHYYMHQGERFIPERWVWTAELWAEIRKELRNEVTS